MMSVPAPAQSSAYASWIRRAAAIILDVLIPYGPALLVLFIFGDPDDPSTPGFAIALYVLFALCGLVAVMVNRWGLGGRGQSWGKKIMGIWLLGEETGQPIGAGRAFVRDIAHVLDNLVLYLGWLAPLVTRKRQTIADMAMRTIVVRPS